jgi:uncharacterized protein (TIGR02145 family)
LSRVQNGLGQITRHARAFASGLLLLSFALNSPGSLCAQDSKGSPTLSSVRRMADGKRWTTLNLNVNAVPSYCYEDSDANCVRYGRLYTWDSARRACESLGREWRLPTDDEWRQLARQYGGVSEDSQDRGKRAYMALLTGGTTGFDALLGGGRSPDGKYARGQAHGFYWTASENDAANAVFYNFAQGSQGLHRQSGGEIDRAFSVRCVSE